MVFNCIIIINKKLLKWVTDKTIYAGIGPWRSLYLRWRHSCPRMPWGHPVSAAGLGALWLKGASEVKFSALRVKVPKAPLGRKCPRRSQGTFLQNTLRDLFTASIVRIEQPRPGPRGRAPSSIYLRPRPSADTAVWVHTIMHCSMDIAWVYKHACARCAWVQGA